MSPDGPGIFTGVFGCAAVSMEDRRLYFVFASLIEIER